MTEWLDVVDNSDSVIGRASRAEVHEKGLLHRSSHIVLFNSVGQVFVQLRSLKKDNHPGLWDSSAAGHVDSGESYLECAVRELSEELGIQLSPSDLQLRGKLTATAENGQEFTHIFSTISDDPLTLQAEEIDAGKWITPAELDDWIKKTPRIFTGTFLIIWDKIRSSLPH